MERTWERLRRALPAVLAFAALAWAAPAAVADTGYRDQTYTATAVGRPSREKPQSKLWFADGIWWGCLFNTASQAYHVYRFDPAKQRWSDTGTQLDDRNSSHADTLWDGTHLYVASATPLSPNIRIFRLNYAAATHTWTRDPAYPMVSIAATAPVEAVVIDKDSTGRLWITYTQNTNGGSNRTVYVAHTSGPPADAWNAPYQLPVGHASDLTPDDISSVVAYGSSIGVMWSNQATQTFHFAAHADGTGDAAANWTQSTAFSGPFAADDHINMKSVQAGTSGRVFAVVKTGIGDTGKVSPFDAQIVLLERTATGAWKSYPVGTVRDDHTRPIVMTDQRTRRLYVFATSPTLDSPGVQTIYYKATSLDAPSFTSGLGTPFMRSSSGFDINDASSTKQDLGSLPYLLVLGSDATNYWHNTFNLGHTSSTTAPVIASLSASPRTFRVAGGRVSPARRLGTTVSFELNEPAFVRLRVDRARPGRRVGRRCLRPTAANRGGRRCIRYVRVASDSGRAAGEGLNRIIFSGRLGRRALASGRYVLIVSARDAAGRAALPAVARFRVLPSG